MVATGAPPECTHLVNREGKRHDGNEGSEDVSKLLSLNDTI